MKFYSPTQYGYPCAAMMRFRSEMVNSKRIEIYPTSQWGDLGVDYTGPENAELVSVRAALQKLKLEKL